MPTYVALFRLTDRGLQNLKKVPDNIELNRCFFGPVMGVRTQQIFLTTGQYDGVAILEADSDQALARMLLTVGSFGNIRTETMRAFSEEESRKILAELP